MNLKLLIYFLIGIISVSRASADVLGDILPKRKNPLADRIMRRESKQHERDEYLKSVVQQTTALNVEREDVVRLVAESSRVKISAKDLLQKCSAPTGDVAEIQLCLDRLALLRRSALDLEVHLAQYSYGTRFPNRAEAAKVLQDVRLLREDLYTITAKWYDDQQQLEVLRVKSMMEAANLDGRQKAICTAAPLKHRSAIQKMKQDLVLARALQDPYLPYRALSAFDQIIQVLEGNRKACDLDISATRSALGELRQQAEIMIVAPEFSIWVKRLCGKVQAKHPHISKCDFHSAGPALVFALHSIHEQDKASK